MKHNQKNRYWAKKTANGHQDGWHDWGNVQITSSLRLLANKLWYRHGHVICSLQMATLQDPWVNYTNDLGGYDFQEWGSVVSRLLLVFNRQSFPRLGLSDWPWEINAISSCINWREGRILQMSGSKLPMIVVNNLDWLKRSFVMTGYYSGNIAQDWGFSRYDMVDWDMTTAPKGAIRNVVNVTAAAANGLVPIRQKTGIFSSEPDGLAL